MTDTPPPVPEAANVYQPAAPAVAVAASGPVRFRTATIVTLSLAAAMLVFFFIGGGNTFSAGFADSTSTFGIFFAEVVAAIAVFVVALVLRSRTKRAGLPTRLATIAVIVSSVLFGILVASAVLLIAVFALLVGAFVGG